jgi:hypothetical protein
MDLWNKGEHNADVLAAQLSRKPEAVRKKLARMGLVVGHEKKNAGTTTTREEETEQETRVRLNIPKELPTIEEILKLQVSAMNALTKGNITKTDIARFKTIIQGTKIYKEMFADYVHYLEIEKELVELSRQVHEMVKNEDEKAVEPRVARRISPTRAYFASLLRPPPAE